MTISSDKVVIIGAGPAGVACSYALGKEGQSSLVIEKNTNIGGLCQTIDFNGYLFDIGGHRFLSKSKIINDLWNRIMKSDLLRVERLSRIFYRKKFFDYPLSFFNTFWNLGAVESAQSIASYLYARIARDADDNTFEGWIINRFGKRLYRIFFKSYTEKIWAMSCNNISADWAAQRIKGLSLRVAIKTALLRNKKTTPTTLAQSFLYPRRGPGEFFNNLAQVAAKHGARFEREKIVTGIKHDSGRILSVEVKHTNCHGKEEIPVEYLFSSIPLPCFIKSLIPPPPIDVIDAASRLNFRSYIAVNVVINKENIFPDQWIYIHSPEVRLGRIQNYKNWSPAMVVDPKKTTLGLEYFCTEGDNFWKMSDFNLIDYAVGELERTGIVSRKHLITGFVVRRSEVYPVYCLDYHKHLQVVRSYLDQFSNFQPIGRAGLFRYCNSDYAMLTGIFAAKNFLEKISYDIWKLGAEQEYFE